jgi:hypothetical protein
VVTVTDEEDWVMAEKRLPNDLTKILELLEPWREEIAWVVVESTFNWYWLLAIGWSTVSKRRALRCI